MAKPTYSLMEIAEYIVKMNNAFENLQNGKSKYFDSNQMSEYRIVGNFKKGYRFYVKANNNTWKNLMDLI